MKLDSVQFYAHAKTLKQQDLAKTLSISRDALYRKLEDTSRLKLTEFLAICVELNMPPTAFFVDAAQGEIK